MPSEYEGEAFKRALFGPTLVPQVYAGQSNAMAGRDAQTDLQDALESMGEQLLATQSTLRKTRMMLFDATTRVHDEMHHHHAFALCSEPMCLGYHMWCREIEKVL
jgi:hypothetical protein